MTPGVHFTCGWLFEASRGSYKADWFFLTLVVGVRCPLAFSNILALEAPRKPDFQALRGSKQRGEGREPPSPQLSWVCEARGTYVHAVTSLPLQNPAGRLR